MGQGAEDLVGGIRWCDQEDPRLGPVKDLEGGVKGLLRSDRDRRNREVLDEKERVVLFREDNGPNARDSQEARDSAFLVDYGKMRLVGPFEEIPQVGEPHIRGDLSLVGSASIGPFDLEFLQGVDREISDVGGRVELVPDLVLVDRVVAAKEQSEDGDEHEGGHKTVVSRHLANHEESADRSVGHAREECGHPDEDERFGLGDDLGKVVVPTRW